MAVIVRLGTVRFTAEIQVTVILVGVLLHRQQERLLRMLVCR